VNSFTDAVFEAEGMGDGSYPDLRRQVREVVDRHMSRWAEAEKAPEPVHAGAEEVRRLADHLGQQHPTGT
jgi:hypothetical protein